MCMYTCIHIYIYINLPLNPDIESHRAIVLSPPAVTNLPLLLEKLIAHTSDLCAWNLLLQWLGTDPN